MLGIGQRSAAATSDAPSATRVQPPAEIAAALPEAHLRGQGTLRFLGFAVYEVRLWASPAFVPERYDAEAFALEFLYARKLEGATISASSIDEMRRVDRFDEARVGGWQAAMARAFPDVARGDRLSGVHLGQGTTHFFHNAKATASIADAEFGRLFFGIWLGATSSEPALRRQLIGEAR